MAKQVKKEEKKNNYLAYFFCQFLGFLLGKIIYEECIKKYLDKPKSDNS